MFRVTSPTKMDDRQLNRLIKRVVLLLVVGTIAFVGFYFMDRWRPATVPIIDRRLSALEQQVRDAPTDIVARGQLADLYVAKSRFEDAIVQYDAILATDKMTELAKYGRAGAYVGLGQLDHAAKDYQAVVDIAKDGEMANVDPMLQAPYYRLGLHRDAAEPACRCHHASREGAGDQTLRRRRHVPDRNRLRCDR